jgi:eukaryotic-like serine/threonine-protein kinase
VVHRPPLRFAGPRHPKNDRSITGPELVLCQLGPDRVGIEALETAQQARHPIIPKPLALSPGTRIGPYEIVAKLGEGGMGEVYRARDTKLDRDVALKVLPPPFAGDADRVARFEREAKTLATLNHPNIAHVYDAGRLRPEGASASQGEQAYLAMELVEGADLSIHTARGPMALQDVRAIARQLIDALEAAHDASIVHRDLKPANIKVRDDGTVKILDFGLARALTPDAGSGIQDAANSPTLTARATQMGMIIGTAAYMAPEQARGKVVDRRADIWAFGVVMYEMLSGKRAFEGEDISVTLANVIKEEARLDQLPADVPIPIRRLLRRCLEKDPKRRLSAIGDARWDLEESETQENRSGGSDGGDRPSRVSVSARLWPALAGAALTALVAYRLWPARDSSSRPEPVQFTMSVERTNVYQGAPKISPDGRWLAYMAPSPTSSSPKPIIWVRPMNGLDPRMLAGTEDAFQLFWSSKSDAIGYGQGTDLFRVDVAGSAPQKLGTVANYAGASWLQTGDILVTSNDGNGKAKLFRVPGQGGVPVELPLPKAQGPASSFGWPVMLPDDKHFVYMGWSPISSERAVYVGSLDGSEPIRLLAADGAPGVAPSYLLFMRSGTLYAQPFDVKTLQLSGEPIRVEDDVMIDPGSGAAAFSVSSTGVLTYRRGNGAREPSELTWLDRNGKSIGTVGDTRYYEQLRLSPDGTRVAVGASEGDNNGTFRISVLDLGNGVTTPFSDDAFRAVDPVWSRDSQSITFVAFGKGNEFFTQQIGSAGTQSVLKSTQSLPWLDDVSPDGKTLLFHAGTPGKLYSASPQDPKSHRLLLETKEEVDSAHFSPDGKWIAYQVSEGGKFQVWVAAFPAMDQRRQVSPNGGGQPWWRGDGRELFYLTADGKFMSVRVDAGPGGTLTLATPVELFQSPLTKPSLVVDQYTPTKDGQRFLFIRPKPTNAAKPSPINVIVNWVESLRAAK